MPSPNLLQQLQSLDRSSPGFSNQLKGFLLGEDCMNHAQDLPCEVLGPFVEYLDNALNDLDPTDRAFCPCLFELRRICGTREVLPTSHLLSDASLITGDHPIASGVLTDIYRGTLKGVLVCVKKARTYFREDPQKVKMLYQEAVVWKRMNHPNIVPFHGVTLRPLQLVSNWMHAADLTECIKKTPKTNRLGLLCDVAEGLNYLHSRNVIHGGIMGANVLVDRLGRAHITDFTLTEIACDKDSTRRVTDLPDYDTRWTAPEVLEGAPRLTKEGDIFSFSMVMVEAFTGAVPFNSSPSITSMVNVIQGERPPRPVDPTLTDGVWSLMQKCWDQEPQSRPEVGKVLQALVLGLLQSLCWSIKSEPEFQVALRQFYDSTERENCVSRLHGSGLKEFVNLLDDVLRINGFDEDLVQRTLYNLREFSKFVNPYAESKYAQVWRGEWNVGGVGNVPTIACVKEIRIEKVHREFRGEIVVWSRLNHPNVLRCFGVMVDPLRILTEWMSNGQAMEYVRAHQDADRVGLLIDVAQGLDYLHSHGIVHGNLKQQNILMDSAGHACLSDIGLAALTPSGGSTFNWADVGANGHRWAAPEIFQSGKLSKQSDVFTYGFVVAEIFVGEFFWEGIDAMGVQSKIVDGERPRQPEDEIERTLTIELWGVFVKCWAAEPESRISVSDILKYLPQPRSGVSYNSVTVATQGQDQAAQEKIDELDKMLETNMISRGERSELLNQLYKMCELQHSPPKSMIIPFLDNVSTTAVRGGGSADTYRGEYEGRPVAVKVMQLYVCSDRGHSLSRFSREAVAWKHLRHLNILPLLGVTLEEYRFSFVSEWMSNGTINGFIRRHTEANRVQLLVDVAHGLEYLHSLNFVHGELKGENILIKNDRRACLADFGLSTIADLAPQRSTDIPTSSKAFKISTDSKTSLMPPGGTVWWMSPELLYPEKFGLEHCKPTKQSDCYALGMVVYEVLRSKVPYWDHEGDVMKAILEGVRPRKPDAAASLGFTDGLWWAVDNCWIEDRSVRPDVKTVLPHLTHAAWAWGRG